MSIEIPGPMRRAQRRALYIFAFRRRRLRLQHRRDQARGILHQLGRGETGLADRSVNDSGLIDTKFHFTGLHFLNGFRHVGGHGSGFGIRHQTARSEDLAEFTHRAHHVRRGDHGVEIGPALRLNLVDHVFAAHEIGAGFGGFALLVAARDNKDGFGFTQPVRHEHRAANHLVRMLWIDAQAHVDLYCFVELGELDLLKKRNRLSRVGNHALRLA